MGTLRHLKNGTTSASTEVGPTVQLSDIHQHSVTASTAHQRAIVLTLIDELQRYVVSIDTATALAHKPIEYPVPFLRNECTGVVAADMSVAAVQELQRRFAADVEAGLRPRWNEEDVSYSRTCESCEAHWIATHWPWQPWAL